MSYNIDMLKFGKNTVKKPLQICFCAATTKNFVGNDTHKVTKQEVEDVDVAAACDAIMDGLSTSENTPRMSLHMSSQLMYGALRVFKEQVLAAEEFSENLFSAVLTNSDVETHPEVAKKKKRINKKNTKTNDEQLADSVLPESVPEIDVINVLSKDLHEDLHLIDEIDICQPPSQLPFSFGFTPDDGDDIDRVNDELQRELMREEQHHLTHSMSRFNEQQDEEAQEDDTLPLPIENGNSTDSMETDAAQSKLQPQNIRNKSCQDILKSRKFPLPFDGRVPTSQLSSSSSENAHTAYSPSRRTRRTLPLEGDLPFATSTPSRRVTSTGEDAPIMQQIDPADVEMFGSQTDTQLPAAVPPMMGDDSAVAALPDRAMEVNDGSDIRDIHLTQVVANKPVKKGKSKKKVVVDRRKEMNLMREPGPQILTKPLTIVILEPINVLLKLPMTLKRKIFNNTGRSWARCLIKMYDKNVQKPYRNFVKMDNFQQDDLREESSQPMVVQLSQDKIILKDLRVVLHRGRVPNESNVTAPEDNLPSLERPGPSENINMQFDEPMDVDWLDDDDVDDEYAGPVDNISITAPIAKKLKSSFLRSATESSNEKVVSNVFLSESEFFDLIQTYWKKIESLRNKGIGVKVAFDEVVNLDNVIRYLIYCFDLEKSRQLYLKQETPFTTVYIIKPLDE